jgi:hypothetical protein
VSDLGDKGLWALAVLAFGALLRWLQQRPIRAARKRAEAAAGAAGTAQLGAVHDHQAAQEAVADAKLAHDVAAIDGMVDAALDADAAARVERERAARAGGGAPERHVD